MTAQDKSAIIGCHLNGATIGQIIVAFGIPYLEVAPVVIEYLETVINNYKKK